MSARRAALSHAERGNAERRFPLLPLLSPSKGRRLYALSAWRETPFFTERERAALAFTESATLMARDHVPAEDYEAVSEQFSEAEIGALVSLIVAINAWNAIGVSTRAWTPGSYEPS